MINIGKYIEMAINWLTENFAGLFDVINHIVGGFIDGFQGILMWVPFYLMIAGIAALAWWKAGKGTAESIRHLSNGYSHRPPAKPAGLSARGATYLRLSYSPIRKGPLS